MFFAPDGATIYPQMLKPPNSGLFQEWALMIQFIQAWHQSRCHGFQFCASVHDKVPASNPHAFQARLIFHLHPNLLEGTFWNPTFISLFLLSFYVFFIIFPWVKSPVWLVKSTVLLFDFRKMREIGMRNPNVAWGLRMMFHPLEAWVVAKSANLTAVGICICIPHKT